MVGAPSSTYSEGLKAARLRMVLGSISPLFIADGWLLAFCASMIIVPIAVPALPQFTTSFETAAS